MKTAEEFVKELHASKELTASLKKIKDDDALEAFLKRNGCGASAKEFTDFMRSLEEGELTDDSAAAVAGGGWIPFV